MQLFNPELRRHLWLDFSVHKLILAPMIIGLMAYLVYLTSGLKQSDTITFTLAWFFIFLWGTKTASEAVLEELNHNTWDFQRQTAISPWTMTLGKLLGSTSLSWYIATIAFIFCILINYIQFFTVPIRSLHEIFILILGGLFSQALALLFSLQILPQHPRERTYKSFRYFIAGAFLGILVTHFCLSSLATEIPPLIIIWHGFSFSAKTFATISLIVFLSWAILGLERSFARELQYQNIPWVWTVFSLFCILYFSGFSLLPYADTKIFKHLLHGRDYQTLFEKSNFYIAFYVSTILIYVTLFIDSLNTIRYKKLFTHIQQKHVMESLQQLPWWVISFLFVIITGIFTTFGKFSQEFNNLFSIQAFIFTSILFIMRDITLIHYFYFRNTPTKILGTLILYLFILYGLVPMLLNALHLYSLLPMFIPSAGENTGLALISVMTQIAFLGMLIWRRWQQLWK